MARWRCCPCASSSSGCRGSFGEAAELTVSYRGPPVQLFVILNRGEGSLSFRLAGSTPTGVSPLDLRALDLNGDGILDLVANSPFSASIWVMLGKGDQSFKERMEYLQGRSSFDLKVADIDGDADPDI